ncbi:MAG: FMN-binding protein [Clostridiales bacterium]|nr:FMN-binding protein [Clostridiales bacterium]
MKKLLIVTFLMVIFGACAQAEIFQGSAQGYGGEVTVLFEKEGRSITSIRAKGEQEDMGYAALYELPQSIVQNGLEFTDVIAGATVTSKAILQAIEHAVPLSITEHEQPTEGPALFDPAKTAEQLAEDYYRPASEGRDGTAYSVRLCTFEEDGIERSLLLYHDTDTGKCYDYFNGRYVFFVFPTIFGEPVDPQYPSPTYFLPYTRLSRAEMIWTMGSSNEGVWNAYHAFNPPPSPPPESGQEKGKSFLEVLMAAATTDSLPPIPDYRNDYRAFYELTVPQGNRFPRVQPAALDVPDSRIPRDKDALVFSAEDWERTRVISAAYTYGYQTIFFAYPKSTDGTGTAWHDLFSDMLLFTKADPSAPMLPNADYLNTLRPGTQLLIGDKKDGYTPGQAVMSHRSLADFLENNRLGQHISRYCHEAATIGDMRRAYEQLPRARQAWLSTQLASTTENKTGPTVSTYPELEDALRTAKNGATILLANDIPLHTGLILPRKKLTLASESADQPFSLYRSEDYEATLLRLSTGSTLALENVRIDGHMQNRPPVQNPVMIVDKGASLTLGEGSSIENHTGLSVINSFPGSTVTLDGGAVRHNRCAFYVLECYGKLTIKAGEISDNLILATDIRGTVFLGGSEKLLMTGGAIHHNVVPSGGGAIYINSGKATAEIKGGEIHHNYGSAGAIYSDARTLTLSGGSIHHNVGDNTGAIFASPGPRDGNTKFIMTSGEITENRALSTGGNFGSSGVHIEGMEWIGDVSSKFKGSFDMRGGAIRNNRGGRGVGLLIYSVDGSATIGPKAVVEGNTILTMAGGKLKDQRVKNNK